MVISDRNTLRAELRKEFPRDRGQLLPALHFLQHEFGYLPDWGMEVVSWHLGIPASEVYGAATSYTELRIRRPGEHVLRVCRGISCTLNGADELYDSASGYLFSNSTEADGTECVTLEEVGCAYMCGLAPVIEWDHQLIGRATGASIDQLLPEVSDR